MPEIRTELSISAARIASMKDLSRVLNTEAAKAEMSLQLWALRRSIDRIEESLKNDSKPLG